MTRCYQHYDAPHRVQVALSAWVGPPLRPAEVAKLTGLPKGSMPLYAALTRLAKSGEVVRRDGCYAWAGGAP